MSANSDVLPPACGTYGGDTMPMGTLTLSSAQPFSSVEMSIPAQALGSSVFLVDNVQVVTAP